MAKPDYRDIEKRLDLKISEIAKNELKGKDTVKRELLCKILHIPVSDKITTENIIRETITPICSDKKMSPNFCKYRLLCNHFNIPVYHRPKIDVFIKSKVLEVLVKANPRSMSSKEVAETLGEKTGKVSYTLCSYRHNNHSWFEAIKEDGEKGYRWKATEAGIEAYQSGEARLLKRKHSNHSTSKRPRRCTTKVSKVLVLLATTPYPLTVGSISVSTNMKPMIVQDILKYDRTSKLPFFERIQRSGSKFYRYQASKAGIEFYYQYQRGI